MDQLVRLDVFKRAADAVLLTDTDGRVRLFNDAAAALFGCDPQSALGAHCWDVSRMWTPDGRQFCSPDCPIQQQARAGQAQPRQWLIHRPSEGDSFEVEMFTVLIPPPRNGRYAGLHMVAPVNGHAARRRDPVAPRPSAAPPGPAGPAFPLGAPDTAAVTEPDTTAAGSAGQARNIHLLSPRELQVLELLAAGYSTPVVAERLFISALTVRNHVRSILTKLGVHRRLEAVLLFLSERSDTSSS